MVDTCVCCGNVVPEGAMVCKRCELKTATERRGDIYDDVCLSKKDVVSLEDIYTHSLEVKTALDPPRGLTIF